MNAQGYGKGPFIDANGKEKRLTLDLVYNPTGVHLPPAREKLEGDYKRVLKVYFMLVPPSSVWLLWKVCHYILY